jgi:hypothetical protein
MIDLLENSTTIGRQENSITTDPLENSITIGHQENSITTDPLENSTTIEPHEKLEKGIENNVLEENLMIGNLEEMGKD